MKVSKEYFGLPRKILKSKLNFGNLKLGSVTFKVFSIIYQFVKCDLQDVDRKTRKFFTIYGQPHANSNVQRLCVPREEKEV